MTTRDGTAAAGPTGRAARHRGQGKAAAYLPPLPDQAGGDPVCSGCERPIEPEQVRRIGSFERASCRTCGLQLVRRGGASWEQIRG